MAEKKLMFKCVNSVIVTTAKTLNFVKIVVVVCGVIIMVIISVMTACSIKYETA